MFAQLWYTWNLSTILESSCSVQSYVKALSVGSLFSCTSGGTWVLRPPGWWSQLDNWPHGAPAHTVLAIQQVQNSVARLAARVRRYNPITSVLRLLHWLPTVYTCQFKILMLTFKALHGQASPCTINMPTPYRPQCSLRSANQLQIADCWLLQGQEQNGVTGHFLLRPPFSGTPYCWCFASHPHSGALKVI